MLPLPSLRGTIDRRILVNFRIDPDALVEILPDQFRPRTVNGVAIGGICCIRLTDMRPQGLPAAIGFSSENAAHRIGVEWDENGKTQSGVYIPRRDTNSRLNTLIGSQAFGRHYQADFEVSETSEQYKLTMRSQHGDEYMKVSAHRTDTIHSDSVFDSVSAASAYHECGKIGYCPSTSSPELKGVKLDTDKWEVQPLMVEEVSASFFERQLPDSAVTFDNALLMTGIPHRWQQQPSKSSNSAAT